MPGIDFQRVRELVGMRQVLELLSFKAVERSGDQFRGPCPLHGGSSPRSRSFSVNLAKHAYKCFRCGAEGNQLDLWAAAQGMTIHEAAIALCTRLSIEPPWIGRRGTETEKRNP